MRLPTLFVASVTASALAAGCAAGDRDMSDAGLTGLTGDPGTTGDEPDEPDEPDDGILFDAGDGNGSAGDDHSGCQKVDFLFVVDNSASMIHNQEALVAAFPGFIDSIQAQVNAQDYHIMVVDSDEDPTVACEGYYPNVQCGDPYVCGSYPCGSYVDLEACDKALGGGVVYPRGGHTANAACGVPDGQRYVTGSQAGLKDTFACMATTGTSGNWSERPMESAITALSPQMQSSGACNEGFIRDDAILVVTMLTTGDDGTSVEASGGDPQVWYDALVAAKGGNAESIVFLAITTPWAGCIPILGCSGAESYDTLVNMFGDRGSLHPIDSEDYVPFFQDAVGIIDGACDDFVPEG